MNTASIKFWRRATVAVTTFLAVAVLALAANAGHQASGVVSMTGCLGNNGNLSNVAIGDAPKSPCGANQQVVHLSGGDITSVGAGNGLSGGASNGAANLSVNFGDFGSCPAGSAIRTIGATATCETDNNTTYSAGNGLSLSGNAFGISSPDCTEPIGPGIESDLVSQWTGTGWACVNRTYFAGHPVTLTGETFRLSSMGCAIGGFWKWQGNGNWSCETDSWAGFEMVSASSGINSNSPKNIQATCPWGKRPIGGGASTDTATPISLALTNSYPFQPTEGPLGNRGGWQASAYEVVASTGSWVLSAYAICVNS